jgi:hypothetical protein
MKQTAKSVFHCKKNKIKWKEQYTMYRVQENEKQVEKLCRWGRGIGAMIYCGFRF